MKVGTLVILGCPNVGKSTLVNTLVAQKIAAVSDKPQTTRTRILGVVHAPDTQLALVDTPGLHRPWHRLNKRMVQTALECLHEADVIAIMVDGRRLPGTGDQFVIEQVASFLREFEDIPVFLLLNKIDLIAKPKVLPILQAFQSLFAWKEMIPISAKLGVNLDRFLELAIKALPEECERYDEDFVTDQTMRQLAAEIIREKVLEQTRAELPHAVAVQIDEFVEEGRLAKIGATILVEKEGQKGIVIGKGGGRLKEIGTAARIEMEQAFDMKVFLELYVKVKGMWRNDDQLLVELGY
ncbi:MAG: GTPase Era [Nitrospirae bacterium]|nr:GTPase Era [Nitrospirota bacterium]